jgi:hypothetical protein
VAMARKLLIASWRYVETGVTPRGVEFSEAVTNQMGLFRKALLRSDWRGFGQSVSWSKRLFWVRPDGIENRGWWTIAALILDGPKL